MDVSSFCGLKHNVKLQGQIFKSSLCLPCISPLVCRGLMQTGNYLPWKFNLIYFFLPLQQEMATWNIWSISQFERITSLIIFPSPNLEWTRPWAYLDIVGFLMLIVCCTNRQLIENDYPKKVLDIFSVDDMTKHANAA